MENVSFTFEDAQRIADTVTTVERSKFLVKPGSLENQSDEFVIIYVSATTKYSDGSQNGNLSYWDETNKTFAQYSPTQTVRIRAANTADTLPVGYVFARFQGVTSRNDSTTGPLYIAVGSSASAGGGGNATIEVVTDVICTPTGIEVATVTLSGADYDNAVIRQFLALSDVIPTSYLGNQNRVVKVNDTATGLEFGPTTGSLAQTFIALTDTPAQFGSNNTYKVLTVASNNAEITFSANNITTTKSLSGGGNPNNPSFVSLSLVNDEINPGINKFYGTNDLGVRAWRTIQLATLSDFPSISGNSNKFLKVNGSATGFEFSTIDLSTLETDVATLQTDLATAQSNITTLQSDLATAQSNISTLQTDLATAQSNIATLQTDLSTAQTDLATAQNNISTLQTDLSTAQSNISTLQTDLGTAQSDISSLDARVTALEGA